MDESVPCLQNSDGFFVFQRKLKGTGPVVARPDGNRSKNDIGGRHKILGEDAVDASAQNSEI